MKNGDDVLECYKQAELLMQGMMTNHVVINDAVFSHWIENSSSFWYVRRTKAGKEFRLVDAENATNEIAFDHQLLADSLARLIGQPVDPMNLPIKDIAMSLDPPKVEFLAFGTRYKLENEVLDTSEIVLHNSGVLSPDGTKTVCVKECDLWVEDRGTGKKYAITDDGTEELGYACGMFDKQNIQALWSPDSKKILTIRLDTRGVRQRPYINYTNGCLKPELMEAKRPYPGDKQVGAYQLVVIDVITGELQEFDYRSLSCSIYDGVIDEKMAWWSLDCRSFYFVDISRGSKEVRVVELDIETNHASVLFTETASTYIRLGNLKEPPLFFPLPESDELIWFSERSGWGHLYLYDLKTGDLKQKITSGDWLVRNTLYYDAKRRELIIQTAGRDLEISPYYRDICRVNIDSGTLTPIITGDFEHVIYTPRCVQVVASNLFGVDGADVDGISPDGQYLVATKSRVNSAPISILLDRDGNEIIELETADVSGLPKNWCWPEPIKLKSSDGHTDIYGVVYRPPGFCPDKSYPVVDFSCGYRHYESVPQGAFMNGPNHAYSYFMGAALAALGFIVVAIEGRGTPHRSKLFQDFNYGDFSSAGDFDDRIEGINQLVKQYPYMDADRIAISGMDANATTIYGLLKYPDFYSVGVMHCYLDPRFSDAAEGEMYNGISSTNVHMSEGMQAENCVENLKAKLLLIDGLKNYMTPVSTFILVEALQQANKDFDMILLPNEGLTIPSYGLRRNWDYLVEHLQELEPPRAFQLTTSIDLLISDWEMNTAETSL